jgi:hypothetical protein
MKIKCRDPTKIPKERLFCIDKRLYKIAISVVMPKEAGSSHGGNKGDDDDGGDEGKEDKDNFGDVDDLDEEDTQQDKNLDKRGT